MNETQTLEDFNEDFYAVDGYYAVWVSGSIPNSEIKDESIIGDAWGFAGDIVRFDPHQGFVDYPDWMDKFPENSINILLIQPLPEADEF